LVEVEFSEGLERIIGERAFSGCCKLKHMNKLPSTLKEIEDEAFAYCSKLESIESPEGLQRIDMGAFGDCHKLKRIKMN
jgi:hypothetical protein